MDVVVLLCKISYLRNVLIYGGNVVRKPALKKDSSSMEDRLETFKEICRRAGLKVTHQRLEIFHVLAQSKDHPSAEEVFEKVRKKVPTIALDTVYRTLTTLEAHGVLARVLLDTRARFDPNLSAHHHFVCTDCNKIDDFYWPAFDTMKPPGKDAPWGRVKSKHVAMKGVCRACLEKKKKAK